MLSDKLKEAQNSEFQSKGSFFKFKEGANKIRVLTEPELFFADFKNGYCFTGCEFEGTAKGLSYVVDMTDGEIKEMRIPYGIVQIIASLQENEDYKFESFPMPYDLTIDVKNAGTMEVEYQTTPRPVRSDVPAVVLEELAKKEAISTLIERRKEKNKEKHAAGGNVVAETPAADKATF